MYLPDSKNGTIFPAPASRESWTTLGEVWDQHRYFSTRMTVEWNAHPSKKKPWWLIPRYSQWKFVMRFSPLGSARFLLVPQKMRKMSSWMGKFALMNSLMFPKMAGTVWTLFFLFAWYFRFLGIMGAPMGVCVWHLKWEIHFKNSSPKLRFSPEKKGSHSFVTSWYFKTLAQALHLDALAVFLSMSAKVLKSSPSVPKLLALGMTSGEEVICVHRTPNPRRIKKTEGHRHIFLHLTLIE